MLDPFDLETDEKPARWYVWVGVFLTVASALLIVEVAILAISLVQRVVG